MGEGRCFEPGKKNTKKSCKKLFFFAQLPYGVKVSSVGRQKKLKTGNF